MMLCAACGYTHLEDWEKEDRLKNNEPLPEKLGTKPFFVSDNSFEFEDKNSAGYGTFGYYNGSFKASLYACPECGTVKITKW